MNVNELYESISPELHGNIAVSANAVTITGKDGKAQAFELGAEVEGKAVEGMAAVKAKEVKDINTDYLAAINQK